MTLTDAIVTILVAVLGSSALSTIITALISKKTIKSTKELGINKGVQLLLYDRIKFLAKCYINQGFITAGDLEDINRMWECYHNDLGGNGFLDSLMSQVKILPIKDNGQ